MGAIAVCTVVSMGAAAFGTVSVSTIDGCLMLQSANTLQTVVVNAVFCGFEPQVQIFCSCI